MAAVFIDYGNRPGCGMGLVRVFCLLVCCVCGLAGLVTASNDTFTTFNDTCTQNLTLSAADPPRRLPPELELVNRTSITYDVRACSDVQVILYAIDLKSEPKPCVINIVMGRNNQSNSVIQNCESGCSEVDSVQENPLDCDVFRRFAVSWGKGGVEVFRFQPENGTWQAFLAHPSTMLGQMHGVFVAYKFGDLSDNTTISEWQFHGPCSEDPEDSSMVTRGHLAGAVICTLLVGIIIGAVCVVYVPKLVRYIREWKRARTTRQSEDAQTAEEMSTLVEAQSPDKPPEPARPRAETEDTKVDVDLTLPGDNPPPAAAAAPSSKRKASNTYTPYHQMGGSAAAPKKDEASPKTPEVSDSTPRKMSGAGRVASPLPALPGDDAGAAVTSGPDEVYVNADAHIYEGMRHEAPIYENRNTGVYEALGPSGKEK